MKILLLFFLLFFYAQAIPVVDINSNKSEIKDFKLSYLIDESQKLNFRDVQTQEFEEGKNRDSLGANVTNVWIKIQLKNRTNREQKLVLHQELAYASLKLNYYEVSENGNLERTKAFLIYPPFAKNQMDGADALFRFTLLAGESKTIYVHQQTNAYLFYKYTIFSQNKSTTYLIKEKIDTVLLVGLLLALIIYNMLIFISSRYKEYLYYSLYLSSATLWIFYMYGALAHYVGVYGEFSYRFNFGLMLNPIFLALFIQVLFKTKTLYKTEHKFLNTVIFLLVLNFISGLIDFNTTLKLLSFSLDYALIVFLWVSISLYRKGNKLVKIFLVAHIFYIIFNIYALLFYMGFVEYNYVSFRGIGIGILIEALLLAYLLSYRLKTNEKEKEEQRDLKLKAIEEKSKSQLMLFQKSKMADMGEMVANIAHQWKQPLSVVAISVGILREKKLLGRLSDEDFVEELSHIDSNILYLSQTVEDFLTYFEPNKAKSDFLLIDAISKVELILGHTLHKNEIELRVSVDREHKVYGLKEEYIQVLITLIRNAIDALKNQDIKIIEVKSSQDAEKTLLCISDNAGGIQEELLSKIFDPYFTTKHQTQGTGLGLYIAKSIVEEGMNGTLKVQNIKRGAKFSIII